MNREIADVARRQILSREADWSGNFRGACPAYGCKSLSASSTSY